MSFWCLQIFLKTNEIFSRNSALASKKRSNLKTRAPVLVLRTVGFYFDSCAGKKVKECFFNLINNFSIFRVKKTNVEQLIWPKNQTPERKSWYLVNSTNPIRNVMFVLRNEKSAWNWTLRKWLSKLWRRRSWKVHYPWWLQMQKSTEKVHLFTLLLKSIFEETLVAFKEFSWFFWFD